MSYENGPAHGRNEAALYTRPPKWQKTSKSDVKNMTMLLIGRQDGSGMMSSRETCRILRLRRLIMAQSSWQNWNSWWWHSSKSDDEQWMSFFFKKKSIRACRIVGFRIAGTQYRQVDGECAQNAPTACMKYNTVCSQARTDMNACMWLKMSELYHLCAPERIRHQVNPCHPLAPQHEEPPGQHDHLRDDTPNRQPLPQEPLPASSGNYSVGKQRAVGKHSQKCANYSVFQRASKAGSCSCQLSTTVYGMRMKKLVKISQREWKNTLEDFLVVICLSLVLVKKRSGTPHTIANQTDPGIGSKAKIAPYKNTWKPLQDTVFWCNLMFAQEKGLQFYQTRSHAVILQDTLPAEWNALRKR